jgi:hypothetical protein
MAGHFVAIACRVLHPRQAELADDLGLGRVLDVERPDDAVLPSLRGVRQERELALVVDAEAMRTVAGRVVEADLLRLAALRDVEDEQTGCGREALSSPPESAPSSHRESRQSTTAACASCTPGGDLTSATFFGIARIAARRGP